MVQKLVLVSLLTFSETNRLLFPGQLAGTRHRNETKLDAQLKLPSFADTFTDHLRESKVISGPENNTVLHKLETMGQLLKMLDFERFMIALMSLKILLKQC